jgi:drug/metabolite transporter (DMT)-like permease
MAKSLLVAGGPGRIFEGCAGMLAALERADDKIVGILSVVGAALLLTGSDSVIKWLSPHYPLHEIVLVRALVALFFILILVKLEGGLAILRTKRPWLHLVRGLLIVIANMSFFVGIASLPLADAIALFFVAPLFITVMSGPVLGEKVGIRRWLAVFMGLVGVVVMLRPGLGTLQPAAFLPLVAALAYAAMQMVTRRLGVTDKAASLAFYIQITFLAVSALIGLAIGDGRFGGHDNASLEFFFRAWLWPQPFDLMLMAFCGFLVAGGSYLLSQAYRVAEAALVAPFEYVALPFAVLWGYQLWGDVPDGVSMLGILLIVSGGLFILYRRPGRNKPAARLD